MFGDNKDPNCYHGADRLLIQALTAGEDQHVGQLIRSNVSHLRAQLASISPAFIRS